MVLFGLAAVCATGVFAEGEKIKVACIGDSITWGYAMTNRVEECYPTRLQEMLGPVYEVGNFGDPGAGAYTRQFKKKSYRLRDKYGPAVAFGADIVVCNLGINDEKGYLGEYVHDGTGTFKIAPGTFREDYIDLLESFAKGGKRPRYIIWTKLAPLDARHRERSSPGPFVMERDLEAVARAVGAETMDLFTPLRKYMNGPHFVADGVHPEGWAQREIARLTAEQIRKGPAVNGAPRAGGGDREFPFIAIRNMGPGAKNPRFTEAIFAANEKHPGLVDEIWFGGCSPYVASPLDEAVVAPQLKYRAECEKRGIKFSLQQGPTLGYDGQRSAPPGLDLPDAVWAMTPDGKRHPGVFCPTSPEVRELNLKLAKAVIGGLKPYSYWPDDDLRMSKRGNRICFCDRCVKDFNARTGRSLSRAQLDDALYGKPGDKAIRADWIAHNCRVLADFASVYREAADAVYPECRLGLQHMNSDAERFSCEYSGGTPKPILEALRGEKTPQVGYRPGYAFYNERKPWDMFRKAYDIMVSTTEAAKFGFVDRMCHEAENWPHMAAEKTPNSQMVENALALAAGCNSLALYWGCDHYGEDDACWSYYFDCLAKWKPFFLGIVEAAKGTVPSGIAVFSGSDRYACDGWLRRSDGTEIKLMENSLPVACLEGDVSAFHLPYSRVASLAETDLTVLFAKTLLMDVSTWSALLKRFPKLPCAAQIAFDDSALAGGALLTVGSDVELFPGGYRAADLQRAIRPQTKDVKRWSSVVGRPDLCGTCSFPSGFGGTVIVVQRMPSWYAWTGPRRKAVLDAVDAAEPKRLTVCLLTGGYRTVLLVRADASGAARMVFLVNPTCGETPPLELRLPGRSSDWRLQDVEHTSMLDEVGAVQGGTIVRIPSLMAWQPVLLKRYEVR